MNIFISAFIAYFSYLSADCFYSTFGEKKVRCGWGQAAVSFLFFVAVLMINLQVLRTIVLIALTFLLSFNFKIKTYNKILLALLFVSVTALNEAVTGGYMFLPIDRGTNAYVDFLACFSAKFIVTVVFFLLKGASLKLFAGKFRRQWLPLYLLPLSAFFVICIINLYFRLTAADSLLNFFALTATIGLLFANILVFRIVDSIVTQTTTENTLAFTKELVKQQQIQYKQLFSNNEAIVKLRHDYKNFLAGLLSQTITSPQDACERIRKELDTLNNLSGAILCGESVIDTVVNYKMQQAKQKEVTIEFSYRNLRGIYIDPCDLSILLGNALDNAIEASEKTSEKKVMLCVIQAQTQLIISIKNPFKGTVEIDTLNTTKANKFFHGYGIEAMRAISNKYDGDILFDAKDGEFTTRIFLNNQKNN